MGKLTLLFVLAAILGGSVLALSTRTLSGLTQRDQSEDQADLLARQIAESGQNLALTAMMGEDGFVDPSIATRDYDGGRFEVDYAAATDRQTATVTVRGYYGGAVHTIESAYEFDPMSFPGPIWLDVPYATSTVTGSPSVTGGPDNLPVRLDRRQYDEAGFGADLPLGALQSDLGGDLAAAGASFQIPSAGAWTGGSAPLLEDVNVGDAEGIYQAALSAMTPADRSFNALNVGNARTWNGTTTITRVGGDLRVRSGGSVTGEGVLIVEGGLVVEPSASLVWTGLVVVRAEQQVLPVTLSGTVRIAGALVVKQEAMPPGGHLDVTVWRDRDGLSRPQGTDQVAPWTAQPGAFPWTQHNHRFDQTHASGQSVYLLRNGGATVHEAEMQFEAALDDAGSDPVYLEFENEAEHGHARYELHVQGGPPMTGTVRDGFPESFRAAGNVHRSQVFPANRLRDFELDIQSLRALKDRFDGVGGCDEWPFCIGENGDRRGALRVRLVRASGNRVLHESAYYWHMRADERAQHDADMAAWRTTVAAGTGFGTTLTMGGDTDVDFALTPLVRLAQRLGFDGNEVRLLNTTTGHTTTADTRAAAAVAHEVTPPNPGTSPPNPAPTPTPVPTPPTLTPAPTPVPTSFPVTVCHVANGTTKTITDAVQFTSHTGHGDTVGACGAPTPDPVLAPAQVAPPCPTNFQVAICNKPGGNGLWRDRLVGCTSVSSHLGHGCLLGTCAANGRPTDDDD